MSAFNRFTTKLKQAVTDAEKTEIDPALKEQIRQFDDTRTQSDHMRDAIKDSLPVTKSNKTEVLGGVMKAAAGKYGTEKPEAAGLLHAGEILVSISKEEKAMLQKVEQEVYTLIKNIDDFQEALKKEKETLKNTATDMDGAKIKAKGKAEPKVQETTRKYEAAKAAVETSVSKLPEYRDKHRQAAKTLLQIERDFHARCTELIDSMIGQCGE